MNLLEELDPACPRACGRTMDDCHEQEDGAECEGGELFRENQRLKADLDHQITATETAEKEADGYKRQLAEVRTGKSRVGDGINRREWTRQQWLDEARGTFYDAFGSAGDLLNGHVSAMWAALAEAERERDLLGRQHQALLDLCVSVERDGANVILTTEIYAIVIQDPADAPSSPDTAAEACGSCDGARWVDDENWQPEQGELQRGREPGSGRIPCGICNHGGWNEPDGQSTADGPEQTDEACPNVSYYGRPCILAPHSPQQSCTFRTSAEDEMEYDFVDGSTLAELLEALSAGGRVAISAAMRWIEYRLFSDHREAQRTFGDHIVTQVKEHAYKISQDEQAAVWRYLDDRPAAGGDGQEAVAR